MSIEHKREYNFYSLDLIQFIIDNFKVLFIVSILSFILSSIISLTIPNKFESKVVLFPSMSTSIAKTLLNEHAVTKETVMQFGEDEETERLLQVLNSDQIRGKIIRKFDLYKHYEIDLEKDRFPETKMISKYTGNFEFKRTKFMALEIRVMDEDPEMAANMANYTASLIDSVMNLIYRERSQKAFKIIEEEFLNRTTYLKSIQDSLTQISKFGVTDYESQAEVFNAAYAKAIAEGNQQAIKTLKEKISTLENYGSKYLYLKDLLNFEIERFTILQQKYAEAKIDAEQDIPYKYVVDNAFKAEKKTYPKRMIIVIFSTFSTFLMCLLLLIIRNQLQKNKELNLNN